ncbi:transmembrane protein 253 [Engraulis encrasicolus]|uniref:transmembrane protein 253 n=1 Tax=Engraulis encrasicolus TaxID=184585 RepID=UPI002FD4E672
MTQNMFQEGLYQVFFKEKPKPRPRTRPLITSSNQTEVKEHRLARWFGTVVNTRLLVTGVVQLLSSLSCILATAAYSCLIFSCSVSMTTPLWASLLYIFSGGLTMALQRKPTKIKAMVLMSLSVLCLLLGLVSLVTFTLKPTDPKPGTIQQHTGMYVLKGSSVFFMVLCVVTSLHTLFLTWRGLQSYSPPYRQDYTSVLQESDDPADPLLGRDDCNL